MRNVTHVKSSGYEICRYFVPSSLTASQATNSGVARARKGRMNSLLTYKLLLDEQAIAVEVGTTNEQTAANRATVLRGFLAGNGLSIDDVIGDEMRTMYADAVARFVATQEEAGRSPRNISNSTSALRRWKESVVQHDTIRALDAESPTPFMDAIGSLFQTVPVKCVARLAAIPMDMLYGWRNGKVPRPSNAKYIMRLESFFGLERNSLVELSGMRYACAKPPVGGVVAAVEYNERLKSLTKDFYCFKPELGSQLRQQWTDLLRYKTARVPAELRHKRGQWRISPCPMTCRTEANWAEFYEGKEVASARIAWARLSSYLGWMHLSETSGGKEFDADVVGTLAWLAVPDFLNEYFDWMKGRLGNHNQSVNHFLGFIASLVRPQLGYLWQHPEFQDTLPEKFRNEDWQALCARQLEMTQRLAAAFRSEIEVSRDSFTPIRNIVDMKQPLDAIADMIQRMRSDRPVGRLRREALWGRDIVLIRILVCNPLRMRNVAHLTWRADNTGNVYQRPDKSWWIRIPKSKFKNARGAAGQMVYDSPVHPTAWRDIERYVNVLRPRLIHQATDLFIVAGGTGNKPHKPWRDLSKRVFVLTARYLPNCIGFSAHAFRHLVATAILKSDGGDFKTAALVLNDRIATVEKHYAALRSGDGAERMATLLEDSYSRM